MSDRNLEKAVSNIVKAFDPVAVATYNGGTGILVVLNSDIESRARRAAFVKDAAGRPGRSFDVMAYTPDEVRELRDEEQCPLCYALLNCEVVHGSLDGLRR